eukprot:TRINITY_DN30981_c0_g1_i1.p1 TRINITY_DN30981_c0_g1~~TRINITY_DN30981_c0_g1_i1.p1  ORF type:complete len:1003 (+),score=204.58 TRINITY_DN30981_c0_g1_i1:98-3106(+)
MSPKLAGLLRGLGQGQAPQNVGNELAGSGPAAPSSQPSDDAAAGRWSPPASSVSSPLTTAPAEREGGSAALPAAKSTPSSSPVAPPLSVSTPAAAPPAAVAPPAAAPAAGRSTDLVPPAAKAQPVLPAPAAPASAKVVAAPTAGITASDLPSRAPSSTSLHSALPSTPASPSAPEPPRHSPPTPPPGSPPSAAASAKERPITTSHAVAATAVPPATVQPPAAPAPPPGRPPVSAPKPPPPLPAALPGATAPAAGPTVVNAKPSVGAPPAYAKPVVPPQGTPPPAASKSMASALAASLSGATPSAASQHVSHAPLSSKQAKTMSPRQECDHEEWLSVGWRGGLDVGQDVMLWSTVTSLALAGVPAACWLRGKVSLAGCSKVVVASERLHKEACSRGAAELQLPLEKRGISAVQLQRFVADCRTRCQREVVKDSREYLDTQGFRRNPDHRKAATVDNSSTASIMVNFIRPLTAQRRAPFVDVMGKLWPELGHELPRHYVSHAWHGSFNSMVKATESVAASCGTASFWISSFALTLDDERQESASQTRASPDGEAGMIFSDVLNTTSISSLVLVLEPTPSSSPLTRKWVSFEVLMAYKNSKTILLRPDNLLEDAGVLASLSAGISWQGAQCDQADDLPFLRREVDKLAGSSESVVCEQLLDALSSALATRVEAIIVDEGEEHVRVAETRRHLGIFMTARRRFPQAEAELVQALGILLPAVGDSDPRVAPFRSSLGDIFRDQGRFNEARAEYEEEVRILTEIHGEAHKSLALPCNNLGAVLMQMGHGHLPDAKTQLEKAIAIKERELGDDHESVGATRNNLASVLAQLGSLTQALREYDKALEIAVKGHGAEALPVAEVHNGRGSALVMKAEYAEAEAAYRKAFEIRQAALDRSHPLVAESRNNLGVALTRQGKIEEALVEYNEALKIKQGAFGDFHPSVADTRNNLGLLFAQQRLIPEARSQYEHALRIRAAFFGDQSVLAMETRANLAALTARTGASACFSFID